MKSGVVAAMLATRALARARDRWRGTLIFTSVIDEEAYSKGAHAVIESGIRADYCVVTESAWDSPCLGAFGKLLVRVEVTGKAAHASWPHLGINAAVEAARFVARLDEMPLGEHPRIAPTRCVLGIRSGQEGYQSITVPDHATVLINWHTVPGERADDVLDRLRVPCRATRFARRVRLRDRPTLLPGLGNAGRRADRPGIRPRLRGGGGHAADLRLLGLRRPQPLLDRSRHPDGDGRSPRRQLPRGRGVGRPAQHPRHRARAAAPGGRPDAARRPIVGAHGDAPGHDATGVRGGNDVSRWGTRAHRRVPLRAPRTRWLVR